LLTRQFCVSIQLTLALSSWAPLSPTLALDELARLISTVLVQIPSTFFLFLSFLASLFRSDLTIRKNSLLISVCLTYQSLLIHSFKLLFWSFLLLHRSASFAPQLAFNWSRELSWPLLPLLPCQGFEPTSKPLKGLFLFSVQLPKASVQSFFLLKQR
jgi:hypothetical protein